MRCKMVHKTGLSFYGLSKNAFKNEDYVTYDYYQIINWNKYGRTQKCLNLRYNPDICKGANGGGGKTLSLQTNLGYPECKSRVLVILP